MGRVKKVVFAKVLALGLVGSAHGDQWTFFHPEEVTEISCSVQEVVEEPLHQSIWQASAFAKRSPEIGNWTMTVGEFQVDPKNPDKGRHKAQKACSKWLDQAGKKMRAAHEPR